MDRTAAAEIGAPTGSPYERRWLALLVLSLSLVVIGLDNTILNVALPTIARSLHTSGSQLQWMVDAYVLVFAGLLLTMGAAGDRFGRKAALNAGLSIFLLTQHLQFVLGYTPLEAGFRVLPIGVLIVAAPLSGPATPSAPPPVWPPGSAERPAPPSWPGPDPPTCTVWTPPSWSRSGSP